MIFITKVLASASTSFMCLPAMLLLFLASSPAVIPRGGEPVARPCTTCVEWAGRTHGAVDLPCQPGALASPSQAGRGQGSFHRAEAADNETEEEGLEELVEACLALTGERDFGSLVLQFCSPLPLHHSLLMSRC